LLATVAVAAYRHARRTGQTLRETVATVDAAVAETFDGEQFVTAVLAELDLATGHLTWHCAGHPAPLLLRGLHLIKSSPREPGMPLGLGGMGDASDEGLLIEGQYLEPGDRLLFYSDGVVEARDPHGEFFGTDRLADLVTRETAAGQPAPETMRRLMHALLDHQAGHPQDDATTMLVEWKTGGERHIVPDHRP